MSQFSIAGEMNVNRMGFGAMRITGKGIFGPPKDKNAALAVLRRAVELGVNFIDTADSYGPAISEELIAEALYPYPKDLVIATKGGLERPGPDVWTQNGHPAHLEKVLNESLRRLKLDKIDLYQLHRIDSKVPAEETFSFLQKAQQAGKVRHLGLSEVNIEQIKQAEQFFKVVSVQNKYSVDNRQWEPVLQYCLENEIAFIPWYPLNAGNIKAQEVLQDLAGRKNISVHQLALSWLLHHAPNILLIPGTSSIAHLEENIASKDITLTHDEMIELDGLSG